MHPSGLKFFREDYFEEAKGQGKGNLKGARKCFALDPILSVLLLDQGFLVCRRQIIKQQVIKILIKVTDYRQDHKAEVV